MAVKSNKFLTINFKVLEYLIAYILIIAMSVSMELYFTWKFSKSLTYVVLATFLIPFLLKLKFSSKNGILILLFFVSYLYNYTHNTTISIVTLLNFISIIIITTYFLISSIEFKQLALRLLNFFLKFICLISLFGWFLYLLEIPLPHYYSDTTDYYSHEVYYLFVVGANNIMDLIPRFCGMFLEPGHIGSTCSLLLYINKYNFKDKSNFIYLFSILFSLSLAAYCLFVIGLCIYYFIEGKNIAKFIFITISLILTLFMIGQHYNNGDNIFNDKILSRLEIVDGELAGDNRTSKLFDSYYDSWLKNGNLLWGYGIDAYGSDNKTNILHGCASYKRFYFVNGILGVILVFILYTSILYRYKSVQGFGFFLLYIICNMIRDYPYRLMWLYIFILGCVSFYLSSKSKHQNQNII